MVNYRKYKTLRKMKKKGKVAKLTRNVNRLMLATESKTRDTKFVFTEVAFDKENATNLSIVPQGDTRITRDGSKILATNINVKMTVRTASGANDFGAAFRVIMIKAKQRFTPITLASGTTQTVLQDQGAVDCVVSPFERDNRSHFTVLYDKSFYINGTNGGTNGYVLNINKKLNHIMEWESTGVVPERGNIWLMLYTDLTDASNDGPQVQYTSRLTFMDS